MGRARKEPEGEPTEVTEAKAQAEEPVLEAEPAAAEPAAGPEAAAEEAAAEGPAPARKAAKRAPAAKPKAEKKPKAPATKAKRSQRERKPIVRTPLPERLRGKRKERRGTVVSSAMEKTIVVRVDMVRPHPEYKKVVRRSHKLHAHDEGNEAKVGDVVRVVETRPLSKTKTWRLAEILEAAK